MVEKAIKIERLKKLKRLLKQTLKIENKEFVQEIAVTEITEIMGIVEEFDLKQIKF